MTMRDNPDIRPVLVKVGLALTLSLAGLFYSRFRVKRIKPYRITSGHDSEISLDRAQRKDDLHAIKRSSSSCNICSEEETFIKKMIGDSTPIGLSPCRKQSGEKDEFLLGDFNDLSSKKDKEAPMSIIGSPPKAYVTPEKDDYDQEIKHLKSMIRKLQDRERSLEVQLLEYYGLREKEAAVMELQNQLKISNMEAKMFDLKVENLLSENRRLEAQVADHAKLMAELESSKAKVKLLKKKIKHEAEQSREQIKNLQIKVSKLQDQEDKVAAGDPDVQMKLLKLKDLESQTEELKKSNLKLQMDNSDLAHRLDSTQILANAVLEDPQTDALKEETERLRQENGCLTKEIEQLQADRCSDIEELVYVRWINACLRFELRNYQPPPGKTVARDLSKTLSPKSEKKAKQLILEYANNEGMMDFDSDQWSTSQASSITDYADGDDYSSIGNSSVPRTNTSNKKKFFSKLRKLIKGKDSNLPRSQSRERFGSQDSNSPLFCSSVSTGIDTGAEGPRSEFTTPRISRSSSDFHRLISLKDENRTNSDSIVLGGSNKFGDFKNCLGPCSDSVSIEKSPLVKYAEALKDPDAVSTSTISISNELFDLGICSSVPCVCSRAASISKHSFSSVTM
ncbi:Protein CHUP1, chloroplastic [Senna tora]|uniref:Protein CHUP1, chloroplastic n=1 Tax=Senna tora TaxID=362788 RepID=A0A835CJD0_9FABA|nr:Protein CHUP1, chloroplastic [Senna tora]